MLFILLCLLSACIIRLCDDCFEEARCCFVGINGKVHISSQHCLC